MFSTGTSTTGTFAHVFGQRAFRFPDLAVKVEMRPTMRPDEIVAVAREAARIIWPDNAYAKNALVPLVASIAREATRRGEPARFRIVRTGDRQRVEPIDTPRTDAPADPEDEAREATDAVVVATERNRIETL